MSGFASESEATDVSGVRGGVAGAGEASRRSLLKRAPASTVDCSESDTLGLLARFLGAGSGRVFLEMWLRVRRPVEVGAALLIEMEGVACLLGRSSEEESSSAGAAALRFRAEVGKSVTVISAPAEAGEDFATMSFEEAALPIAFETRAKLLRVEIAGCCWEVALPPNLVDG